MKKILCPTDFTETAQEAVHCAARVCQSTGAQLTLFHALTFGELVPNELIYGRSVTVDATQYYLDQLCGEIMEVYKISCEVEVARSNRSVAQVIKDESDRFDLIVMGSNGPDNFIEYFTGSSTFQVAKGTDRPLLLIPAQCKFDEIKEIVCASDYILSCNARYNQLLTWASLFNAHLTLLQVLPEFEYAREAQTLEVRQFQLRKLFDGRLNVDFRILRDADPAMAIHHFISQNSCDALAVHLQRSSGRYNFFHKSVTKSLSEIAITPLFIFHN